MRVEAAHSSGVDAAPADLDALADRVHALEDVATAIRESRSYRLLRLLGRWRGVEDALERLLDGTVPTDRSPSIEALARPVRVRAHTLTTELPQETSLLIGVRLQNTGHRAMVFQAPHTAFWATSAAGPRFAVEVSVDGVTRGHAQIPGDRLGPRSTATVLVPLETGPAGVHRFELVLVTQPPRSGGAGRAEADGETLDLRSGDHRKPLLAHAYSVGRPGPVAELRAGIRRRWFMARHAGWPRLVGRLRCWHGRRALARTDRIDRRRERLRVLKADNARLAFMEKQARVLRVASRPAYLTLDSTTACNLRCPLCYREDPVASSVLPAAPHMAPAVLREVIDTLFPTAVTVNPSGWGEPLLSPHLDTIIEACEAYGVRLALTTNGVLLNRPGLLDRLVPVLHWLEISIDSLDQARFEALRHGASFARVIANTLEVGRRRQAPRRPTFDLGVSMTLFRDNLAEVPDMLRFVSRSGGSVLKADIGVIFDRRQEHRSVLACPGEYNRIYDGAQPLAAELGVRLFMRAPFTDARPSEAGRHGICDYLYTHASVSSDGSFRPCYSPVLPSRAALAGLRLSESWNSPAMQRLRRDHDTARGSHSCQTCYVTRRGPDSLASRRVQFIRSSAPAR